MSSIAAGRCVASMAQGGLLRRQARAAGSAFDETIVCFEQTKELVQDIARDTGPRALLFMIDKVELDGE